MAPKTFATASALASIFTTRLASADVSISVEYDATYSLSESCGAPCSGDGAEPTGNACPKAGDVAIADCHSHLLSYNGANCVAPVDAHCVIVHDNVWGCAFPKMEYTSAGEVDAVASYEAWGTSDEDGHAVKEAPVSGDYDQSLDSPLGVNCDVVTESTSDHMGGAKEGEVVYGNMVDHQTSIESDHDATSHYNSLRTGTTESDKTESDNDSHDLPMNVHYGTTGTTEKDNTMTATHDIGMRGAYEGSISTGGYTTGMTHEAKTAVTGGYYAKTPEGGESMESFAGDMKIEGETPMTGGYTGETPEGGKSMGYYHTEMTTEDEAAMTGGYTTESTEKGESEMTKPESKSAMHGEYTTGMTTADETAVTGGASTPNIDDGTPSEAQPIDHMPYESGAYMAGHNEHHQVHENVTPDPHMTGSSETEHDPESTMDQTHQSPYGSQEESTTASKDVPCDLSAPEDETVSMATMTPLVPPATASMEPLLSPFPIKEPPTTMSPCSDEGINGVKVETQVRYSNLDIISTTAGIGQEQSWRSCCEQCLSNLVCVTFSFEQLVSANVCVLTGSANGKTTQLPNWQSGNVLNVRALVSV